VCAGRDLQRGLHGWQLHVALRRRREVQHRVHGRRLLHDLQRRRVHEQLPAGRDVLVHGDGVQVKVRPISGLTLCLALLAGAGAATTAGPASAQTPAEKARAKEAYDRGVEAHKRGDLQRAAEEFAKADAIAPSNVALQAALDAAVEADDPALGSELVERSGRAQPAGALAASVDAARKKFTGRAGRVRVTCPPGSTCLATIDGATAPVGKPAWTRAGQHSVVVQIDGESQTKLVDVKADQVTEVAPTKAAAAAPPAAATVAPPAPAAPPTGTAAPEPAPREQAASHGLPPFVFFIGVGATVLAGGGAAVMGLVTKGAHDDFVAAGCDRADADGCADKKNSGETSQLVSNVALGATAVFGVATIIIGAAFTDWKGGKSAAATPVVTPVAGGAVAGWSGRF